MLSDERFKVAQQALRTQSASFSAAVEAAYAEVHAYLATHAVRSDERAREAGLELGGFAHGRIDIGRLAAAVGPARVLTPQEETVVRRCAEVMDEVIAQREGIFTCIVERGGDLRSAVENALGEVGRAFGAALVFQAVKVGVYHAEQHDPALRAFPFRRWNRNERMIAPPLIVSVDGADLQPGVLGEYLDGRQKIALVVSGKSTPVPIARLITPGVFVLQTDAPDDLARLSAADAPGIAALLPAPAAWLLHDPTTGALEVARLPDGAPRAAVGGWSTWQQEDEIALVRRLLAGDTVAAHGAEVDAIANWLVAQAGLGGGTA